jgi:hypothetical protein
MSTARDRYGRRLDAIPALAQFCERADEVVRAGDPDTFWDVQPSFHELLKTDIVEAFVTYELGVIAERPLHFVLGSSDFHAPLVETDAYSLVIKVLPPEVALGPLGSLTEHTLVAVWEGRADLETLALEPPFRIDVFDRSKRLVPASRTALVPGVVGGVRAPAETFRLHLERPTVVIQLQSATVASLRWVFHPETLEPVRATAARLGSSRLQFTCQTLGALGSPSSIPALKRLVAHPEHYVRWAAIQGICAISREEGITCLQRALADDDHPHIRRAASETLAHC